MRQEIKIVYQKIYQNTLTNQCIFVDFLVNNFDFLTQKARKTNFDIKLILETCSGTSNYAYYVISWRQSTCWDSRDGKSQKMCEKIQSSHFRQFFGGGGYATL